MAQNDVIIDKLLYELNIIARIEKGKKISTVDSECLNVIEPSVGSGVYRWAHGDSRERLISSIEYRLNLACSICEKLLESRYLAIYDDHTANPLDADVERFNRRKLQIAKILEAIGNLPVGLGVLCETYATDNYLRFRLGSIAAQINKHIAFEIAQELRKVKDKEQRWKIWREQNSPAAGNSPAKTPDRASKLADRPVASSQPQTIPRAVPEPAALFPPAPAGNSPPPVAASQNMLLAMPASKKTDDNPDESY